MKNMAIALLVSPKKRIFTTVAKAKALRQYVEPLITKGKDNTTHSRRTAFSYLQNKEAVKELFGQVAAKVGDRPGGYTRILKIGARQGDNAEMALIELVDFNEFATEKPKKKSSRRRKKTGGAGKSAEAPKAEPKKEEPKVELKKETEAPAAEEAAEETKGEAE
jgi:large subunit ribosomal protein L17